MGGGPHRGTPPWAGTTPFFPGESQGGITPVPRRNFSRRPGPKIRGPLYFEIAPSGERSFYSPKEGRDMRRVPRGNSLGGNKESETWGPRETGISTPAPWGPWARTFVFLGVFPPRDLMGSFPPKPGGLAAPPWAPGFSSLGGLGPRQ